MIDPEEGKHDKDLTNHLGRPTKYSLDIIHKTQDYINLCEDTEEQVITGDSENWTKYETKLKVKLPSIEGLARFLKVHRDTLYQWKKLYPDFSDIFEELLQKQAEVLLNKGLSGEYNSTIAKVILTKHGYTDKQEIDQKTEHSGEIVIKWQDPDIQHPEDKGSNGEL